VIIAMLIVALAATAASAALQRQDLLVRQLEAARDYEQARWLLTGGAHWSRTILFEDGRAGSIDHSGELWASGLAPTEVERATLAGDIRDAQALFNLANLVRDGKPSAADVTALERLLSALGLEPDLADAIAAAMPMRELGELTRIRGLDERLLARLRPFVSLLPNRTPVNVNTARPEVLVAAVEGLRLAEALVLAQEIKGAPVRNLAEFRERLPRPELKVEDAAVSVGSGYFLVDGRARLGSADVRMEALLQRSGDGLPIIVWQRTS
jgi:general secretion pathway protein K